MALLFYSIVQLNLTLNAYGITEYLTKAIQKHTWKKT